MQRFSSAPKRCDLIPDVEVSHFSAHKKNGGWGWEAIVQMLGESSAPPPPPHTHPELNICHSLPRANVLMLSQAAELLNPALGF